MLIYHYDRDTLEFTGMSEAEVNQVGAGYLIPAFASTEKPPECSQFEKPFFIKNSWVIMPHYKGLKQIDIETKLVTTIDYYGNIKDGFLYIQNETADDITNNPNRYKIENKKIIRLCDEEYNKLVKFENNQSRINEIKNKLDKLDLKYIRAFSEGGEKETGLLWTDYYKNEITSLRTELKNLETENSIL